MNSETMSPAPEQRETCETFVASLIMASTEGRDRWTVEDAAYSPIIGRIVFNVRNDYAILHDLKAELLTYEMFFTEIIFRGGFVVKII